MAFGNTLKGYHKISKVSINIRSIHVIVVNIRMFNIISQYKRQQDMHRIGQYNITRFFSRRVRQRLALTALVNAHLNSVVNISIGERKNLN